MLKRPKIKILILLITIIIIGGYFFLSSLIGNPKFSNLKSLLNVEQKELIKKYIFPYKTISQQQQTISNLDKPFIKLELADKENDIEIEIFKKSKKLSNYKTLDKYKLVNGFYAGISNQFPGSGYINFHKGNKGNS